MIKFNGLDGMRSFACIGFVAMHVRGNLHVRPSFNMLIDNVLDCAGDFVLLFMMISAFFSFFLTFCRRFVLFIGLLIPEIVLLYYFSY